MKYDLIYCLTSQLNELVYLFIYRGKLAWRLGTDIECHPEVLSQRARAISRVQPRPGRNATTDYKMPMSDPRRVFDFVSHPNR
jgi:hypothetical protein